MTALETIQLNSGAAALFNCASEQFEVSVTPLSRSAGMARGVYTI